MLEKGDRVAGKERQFTHMTAKYRRLRALFVQRRLNLGRSGDVADGGPAVTQASQLDRAIAVQELGRCPELIDHELGNRTMSRQLRYHFRQKAKECENGT